MDDQIIIVDTLKAEKGFKLLHLNVRSLTKKIDQLRIMFEESKLDVITLSETWLNESVNSKSVNFKDRQQSSRCGSRFMEFLKNYDSYNVM